MSDTDDTDFLILLPPDFFYVHSESEDSIEADLRNYHNNCYTSGSSDHTEMGQYSYEITLVKSKPLPVLCTPPVVANIESDTSGNASDTVSLVELDSLENTNIQHKKIRIPPFRIEENVSSHSSNSYLGVNKPQAVLKEEVDLFLEIVENDMHCHEEKPLNRKMVLKLSDFANCSDVCPKETGSSTADLKLKTLSQDGSEVIQLEEMVIQQMNSVPVNTDTDLKETEIDSIAENIKPGLITLSEIFPVRFQYVNGSSLSVDNANFQSGQPEAITKGGITQVFNTNSRNDNAVNLYSKCTSHSEVFSYQEGKIFIEAQHSKSSILGSSDAEVTKPDNKNEPEGAVETLFSTYPIEETCTTETPHTVNYQEPVDAIVRGHSLSLPTTSVVLPCVGCGNSGGKCSSSSVHVQSLLLDTHLNNEVSISSTVQNVPIHILQGTANITEYPNFKKDSQDIYISCEKEQRDSRKLNDHPTTSTNIPKINDKEKQDRHELQKDCVGGLGFQPALPERNTHSTNSSTCKSLTTRYICPECGSFAGYFDTSRLKVEKESTRNGGCESFIHLPRKNLEHQQTFAHVADSDEKGENMILTLQNDYKNMEERCRALEEKSKNLEYELLKEKHDHQAKIKMLEEKERSLAAAKIRMEELRTQVESTKAEVLAARKEKERLEFKLKEEEEERFHLVGQQQLKLQTLLNQSRCKEKSLQERIRNITSQKENIKSELHRFYQDQLEKVVRSKLSEFQQRLDHTEATLFNEMRKQEQDALNLASKKLKDIAQKHSDEIRLMEKRHKEELKLCQLELSRRVKITCLLKAKLQNLREENKVIVQKLLYMMETCQEAMKIMEVYNEAATPMLKKGSTDENL